MKYKARSVAHVEQHERVLYADHAQIWRSKARMSNS